MEKFWKPVFLPFITLCIFDRSRNSNAPKQIWIFCGEPKKETIRIVCNFRHVYEFENGHQYDYECGHQYDYKCGHLYGYECRIYMTTNVGIQMTMNVACI